MSRRVLFILWRVMFLYSIRGVRGKLKYCPVVASARVKVLQIETDSAIGICIAGYVMYATSSSRAAIPSKLNQNVFQNNTNLLRCELDFLAKIKYNMHA